MLENVLKNSEIIEMPTLYIVKEEDLNIFQKKYSYCDFPFL